MKAEDINKLYTVTPEIHDSVAQALRDLDDKAPERYRKRKNAKRFAVVFAVVILLAVFTTVAYATHMFGFLTERVGKYGVNMQIVQATPDSVVNKKHAKPDPKYLPKGFRQIVDESDQSKVSEGVTVYNPYGDYAYTDGADSFVNFFVKDAGEFQIEGTYIVDYSEQWCNGNKTVFYTRQFQDNGEKYYCAVEYFEDWGYVVVCECYDKNELAEIMEHLDLQEADDYSEPVTIDLSDDPAADYACTIENEKISRPFGKAFIWTQQTYYSKHNEYEINVKSIQENDGIQGFDRKNLLAPDDDEWYSRYFNSDGSLITPYIRTSYGDGDGINTIGHVERKESERHFYIVTVDIKAVGNTTESFIGQFITDGYGGVIYQDTHYKNGAGTITLGVIADEDELDKLALALQSMEIIIDDENKTVVRREIETVIPLPVDQ